MNPEQKEVSIFVTLIAFIIIAFVGLYFLQLLTEIAVLIIILIVLAVLYSRSSSFLIQLQEYERGVVFRMGRYERLVGPGWVILIPFVETYKRMDLRIQTVDIPPQEVVTNDNIKLSMDAVLFIKVEDPVKAVIKVQDYEKSAVSNIQASMRAVIGRMKLSGVITNMSKVNKLLKEEAAQVSKDWGVVIEDVEIQTLVLPESVQEAMHKLKEAEQQKLAAKEIAAGKKITIDAIQAAAGKLTDPTLQYMYLQALERIAEGKSNKIIFPLELSKLASGLASKIGQPYSKAQEKVLDRYQELAKEGKKTRSILEELREEIGVPKPTKPRVKPRKRHKKRR